MATLTITIRVTRAAKSTTIDDKIERLVKWDLIFQYHMSQNTLPNLKGLCAPKQSVYKNCIYSATGEIKCQEPTVCTPYKVPFARDPPASREIRVTEPFCPGAPGARPLLPDDYEIKSIGEYLDFRGSPVEVEGDNHQDPPAPQCPVRQTSRVPQA